MTVLHLEKHNIIVGEVFASANPARVSTLLGSCIAACLYDADACVGGMNHFLLPSQSQDSEASARFGVHAMELLINKIMNLGGDRRRLQAKVFGGANVLDMKGSSLRIGDRNCRFVKEFLATERIPIVSQKVGGVSAMQVQFLTHTGKAFAKELSNRSRAGVLEQESRFTKAPAVTPPAEDDITLF